MCTAAAPILVVPLLSILVSQALSLFFSSTIIPSPDASHTKEERKRERKTRTTKLPHAAAAANQKSILEREQEQQEGR